MKRAGRSSVAKERISPLEMAPEEFRALGYELVDRIASFLGSLPARRVSPAEHVEEVRGLLGDGSLPVRGTDPARLLEETASLLFEHSLFNGHPRFWGYITSSAAPIGALGDLLASAVNPNVGAWALSPLASEIERQTVRWIAEMIGFPTDCGGVLVSGGNMANFIGFLVARKAKVPWDAQRCGLNDREGRTLRVYTSAETHTWIEKAADQYGLGTDAVRWVPTDARMRMDTGALRERIQEDRERGDLPLMVVGTAGSTSTGAVDPLLELAAICSEHDLWFHVDAAYGGFAAGLPEAPADLKGLAHADSVAVDPHKWLYAPLEAGCALVREPTRMRDAFSYHPPYYAFGGEESEPPTNYYEYGPQNSRGFRALKVWLALKQVGCEGYARMIADDIGLAKALYRRVDAQPELQALTQSLSITTFRFVPVGLERGGEEVESYLNQLNMELLKQLQEGGDAYPSHAMVTGRYALRVCIVNFRTSRADIEALPEQVMALGRKLDAALRPEVLRRR